MTSTTSTDRVTLEILTRPAELAKPREYRPPMARKIDDALQLRHATTKDGDGWEHFAWTVRLSYQGRSMESPWRSGLGLLDIGRRAIGSYARHATPKEPTARDVLESLILDAQGYDRARSFEDWAADYGMDTDSRKAEQLYRQCGDLAKQLAEMLGGRPWMDEHGTTDAEELAKQLAGIEES